MADCAPLSERAWLCDREAPSAIVVGGESVVASGSGAEPSIAATVEAGRQVRGARAGALRQIRRSSTGPDEPARLSPGGWAISPRAGRGGGGAVSRGSRRPSAVSATVPPACKTHCARGEPVVPCAAIIAAAAADIASALPSLSYGSCPGACYVSELGNTNPIYCTHT